MNPDEDESTTKSLTWYPVSTQVLDDLERRFTYHAPKSDQAQRYQRIRDQAGGLANIIAALTPASREQSLAFTHLEEAVMWANAAIARNE